MEVFGAQRRKEEVSETIHLAINLKCKGEKVK